VTVKAYAEGVVSVIENVSLNVEFCEITQKLTVLAVLFDKINVGDGIGYIVLLV